MDTLNIVKIKAEKANALRRDLRKITGLFRVIEICIILVLVSRFSALLPVAIKSSGVYFRDLSVVLASPRFVFFIGNAILITLFAMSGHFSGQEPSTKSSTTDFYDEFVEKSKKTQQNNEFEVVYQQKQRKTEDSIAVKEIVTSCEAKNYKRSQSESLKVDCGEKSRPVLRRSETEKGQEIVSVDRGATKNNPFPEDKMSNEEFRSKIEAFIARQQRFRREEAEYSVF